MLTFNDRNTIPSFYRFSWLVRLKECQKEPRNNFIPKPGKWSISPVTILEIYAVCKKKKITGINLHIRMSLACKEQGEIKRKGIAMKRLLEKEVYYLGDKNDNIPIACL